MQTVAVAKRLVELCNQGQFEQAMSELYAENIVSVEAFEMPAPPDMPKMPRETRGLENVRKKTEWWVTNHEVHSAKATGPFVSAEKFAVLFSMDVTFKPKNQRIAMTEVGVYTVEGGKVVHEEFLYDAKGMPGM